MNYIVCVILFLNIINRITSLHLNSYQINLINNLVQNPLLQKKERSTINLILYNAYEKWSIKKAVDFKNLHKYKCTNIQLEELIFYSKIGLFKSVQKYNGKYNFINYSSIYVNSELLKLLTETYSLTNVPKKYRSKSKTFFSENELNKYQFLLEKNLASQYKNWEIDSLFVKNNKNEEANKIIQKYTDINNLNIAIDNISPLAKSILHLKYDYNGNKIRSNKNIAELVGCSEETIRKNLKNGIKNDIKRDTKNNNLKQMVDI